MSALLDSPAPDAVDCDGIELLDTIPIPGRPCRATRWRWALRGVSRRGQRVILRTIVIGGRHYCRREWVDAFIGACSAGDPAPAPTMTASRRQRQARAAMDALTAMK
jgi:hypothetical protein